MTSNEAVWARLIESQDVVVLTVSTIWRHREHHRSVTPVHGEPVSTDRAIEDQQTDSFGDQAIVGAMKTNV